MISKQEKLTLSPFMQIYDIVVPKNNMLRQINELVDFSFILEELKTKYCLDNGRNAIPPIRMFKYLLLKVIFDISDVDVVERSKYDMSFKYFLDMAPEDEVINPSSLTKFRRLRLKDTNLIDMLISKSVSIAVEKDIIKDKSVIVDATHTASRYIYKSPKEFIQEKSKRVRKTVQLFDQTISANLPDEPSTEKIQDHISYCQEIIKIIESEPKVQGIPAVVEKLNNLKETVEDYSEGVYYSVDEDARIGHKSASTSFYGYKTHIAMSDERIITAAVISSGEKSDGHYLEELISKTKSHGLSIEKVIADAAYSGKKNLRLTKDLGMSLISRLNPSITQAGQRKDGFDYNKDAGMYVCPAGHLAIRKARIGRKNVGKNQLQTYYFDIQKCINCPIKSGCYKEGAKSKTYSISIKSQEHSDQAAFQETTEFKTISRSRYKIEAKNSELKNRHGYNKASYGGLFGMQIQGATTIFAVNLKRIIKLMQ